MILWQNGYSLNISSMDVQHKMWVKIISDLNVAIQERKVDKEMKNILNRVINYTKFHFIAEEQLLGKYKYPKLEEHKKIHAKFVKEINDLLDRHAKGENVFTAEILHMLFGWLINHIITVDKKYAKFLQDKGVI